jgi:SNF2 family DNA or RNA helicase
MTPTYSWETYTQTNARIVRTGQSHETIVYRILAKGTIDPAVAEVLRMKEEGHTGLMSAIKALQILKKSA